MTSTTPAVRAVYPQTERWESYGKCAVARRADTLLEKIPDSGALILGYPIYFGTVTGPDAVLHRATDVPIPDIHEITGFALPKEDATAFVCTINVSGRQMEENYSLHIGANEHVLKMIFGHAETSPLMRSALHS